MNPEELFMPPKKKPGPKPRLKSELTKLHTYSFPPEITRFMRTVKYPGAFIKSLIVNSDEYRGLYGIQK